MLEGDGPAGDGLAFPCMWTLCLGLEQLLMENDQFSVNVMQIYPFLVHIDCVSVMN